MPAPIRVLVSGAGKMGRTIVAALDSADDLVPVGVVDKFADASTLALTAGAAIPMITDAATALDATRPDVVIDFTNAAWTPVIAREALARNVRLVIGTTGLDDTFVAGLDRGCREHKIGAVLAANFAIGAVLLMHMAKIASRFFDAAEIIELHHDQKVDAPSGTAIATARGMLEARDNRPFDRNVPEAQPIEGTRAGACDGITIHSVRLPGLVAHQEVIFGGLGQTLTIRHDTTGRDSFMPGILLAAREVIHREQLIIGLDTLVGLK